MKTDYEKRNFVENIKTCTDRTLLGWLEHNVSRLKETIFIELEQIEKLIEEARKRLKVDDHKNIRVERLNPKTGKWVEK